MGIGKIAGRRNPVSTKVISNYSGISRRYLEQLTVSLKNAGLIKGHCGRGGGYTLARHAHDISLGEILTAAVGPVHIAECANDTENCLHADFCSCRLFYLLLDRQLNTLFRSFTLADLLEEEGTRRIQDAIASLDDGIPLSDAPAGTWLSTENDCPRS